MSHVSQITHTLARVRATTTHHDANTETQAISEICQRVSQTSNSTVAMSFKVGEAPTPHPENLSRTLLCPALHTQIRTPPCVRATITHHDMNTGTQAISEICQRVSRSSISRSAISFKVGEAPTPHPLNLPGNSLHLFSLGNIDQLPKSITDLNLSYTRLEGR